MAAPTPFTFSPAPADVSDLLSRLRSARLPPPEPSGLRDPWAMGVPLRVLQNARDAWLASDISAMLEEINSVPGYKLDLPKLPGTHFFHLRSRRPDAVPLLLCHGWPQTSVEFIDILPSLADPADSAAPAFHVVVPSLPGYLFSDPAPKSGTGIDAIAKGWVELMGILGYERFLVHGGDWGSFVSRWIGVVAPDRAMGVHITAPRFLPPDPSLSLAYIRHRLSEYLPSGWTYTPAEEAEMAAFAKHQRRNQGYSEIQRTRPQTIGASLSDSPLGLLAWHLCLYHTWGETPPTADLPPRIPLSKILRILTLVWLTNTGATSARMYFEDFGVIGGRVFTERIPVPLGVAGFPGEPGKAPRWWAEARGTEVLRWKEFPKGEGGHFAAMENAGALVGEIRGFCRDVERRARRLGAKL
ncbi:Alpha/Beta hydrolase protein [Hyaloraphidium curvatum]|nr:Alpha/Beta hydrolase protein [Hyaloraphidium curvatum]